MGEEKKKAADQAGLEQSEKKRSERETEKRLKEDGQMLLDSLEKESLGVKASELKKQEKKDKKEEIKPKLGRPSSLKNKESSSGSRDKEKKKEESRREKE